MGLAPGVITAAGLLLGLLLLGVGATNAVAYLAKLVPRAVIRGVQLAVGTLLMVKGLEMILGTFDIGENVFALDGAMLGPIPVGILLGIAGGAAALLLLNNSKIPAALVVIGFGVLLGLVGGGWSTLATIRPGIFLPQWLPYGWPSMADISSALVVLVIPQIPMTLGNAVMAYTDLSKTYFKDNSQRVTNQAACVSMGLVNVVGALCGGMPLCHGAGGLAAHYRFGARTAGSNVAIGLLFLICALFFGPHMVTLARLFPLALLGVLLVFSGGQLAMTIIDIHRRSDIFVAIIILALTFTTNLAIGFLVGIVVAWGMKSGRLHI
jgi:SulP family sulfate permease